MAKAFFFDTYALVEVAKGNQNYDHYKKAGIITTDFNLAELYFVLMKNRYARTDQYYRELAEFSIRPAQEIIKKAAIMKLNKGPKNFSHFDCIGYVTAKELNIKFLTGDKEFENMENVEFAK